MAAPDRHLLLGLQVFRGLAAIIVILYHVNLQFLRAVPEALTQDEQGIAWIFHRMGFLGVDFFFVLSGFIIYHVHRRDWGNPDAWRLFLTKRFVRIQPLLAVIVAAKCAYLVLASPGKLEFGIVVRTLLCLPGTKLVGVSWTLTYEWLFYLVFSVAILFGGRALRSLCMFWSAAILCAALLSWAPENAWAGVLVSPYPLQFLAGVLVAAVFREGVNAERMRLPLALTAAALIACGLFLPPFSLTPREISGVGQQFAGRLYWGIAFAVAVGWSITAEQQFRSRAWKPLVLTGNASYAIYLFHNETITLMLKVWEKVHFAGQEHIVLCMWVFCILAFSVGLTIHIFIEKPLLRWGRDNLTRPMQLRLHPHPASG